MKMFFAPNGKPITTASAVSFHSPDVEIDEDTGTSGLGDFSDFPSFEQLELPGLGPLLMDNDGSEWLESHCRLIEVDADYDMWAVASEAPPWDAAISDACHRVAWLGQTLWGVKKLRDWSPSDIREDVTINAVLERIIVGRVQAEIDTLQLRVTAYRKDRVEPTKLETEEDDDAN